MFERFSAEARQVVLGAVEVAERVGAERVDSVHLLASLARDPGPAGAALAAVGVGADRVVADLPGPVDPAALRAVGIDWDEVRAAVDAQFGAGTLERALHRRGRRRHRPFTPAAKQVLERSLRAAIAVGDRRLVPGHVLLGVLADRDGAAVRLLTGYGVDPAALHTAVLATLTTPGQNRRAG